MRMLQIKTIAAAVVAAGLTASPAAAAITVTVGGGWTEFYFGDVGSPFLDEPFEFTLTGPALLKITDAFDSGDQFEIFINSVSQGLSSVPVEGLNFDEDYDAAFAAPEFSSVSYVLGIGAYSVTGIATLSPFGGGRGAMELERLAAIPEPATWAMLIAGFGMVGLAMRRRARTAAA